MKQYLTVLFHRKYYNISCSIGIYYAMQTILTLK